MLTILLLSLVGTVLSAVVGSIWYSNKTPMGKLHMRFLGMDKMSAKECKEKMEAAKPMMPKFYAAQMLLSFLTSFAVVFVITESLQNGLPFSIAIIFPLFTWLCYMVPVIGSAIIWGNCAPGIAWKKFFSDSACYLVNILLIEVMTGLVVR